MKANGRHRQKSLIKKYLPIQSMISSYSENSQHPRCGVILARVFLIKLFFFKHCFYNCIPFHYQLTQQFPILNKNCYSKPLLSISVIGLPQTRRLFLLFGVVSGLFQPVLVFYVFYRVFSLFTSNNVTEYLTCKFTINHLHADFFKKWGKRYQKMGHL